MRDTALWFGIGMYEPEQKGNIRAYVCDTMKAGIDEMT